MSKLQIPLWLPLAILFAVGVFGFVVPSWTTAIAQLGQMSGISDAWAGFAGAIISSVLTIVATIAGAVIAWFAIKNQNRINIVMREEERIEDQLPGLIEASEFVSVLAVQFSSYVSGSSALSTLAAWGFERTTTAFLAEVRSRIPAAPDPVQRRLANILNAIWATAVTIRAKEDEAERALAMARAELAPAEYKSESAKRWSRVSHDVADTRAMLAEYASVVISMNTELADRVKQLKARQGLCRTEIERFFAEAG